jgi:hypothetical protein
MPNTRFEFELMIITKQGANAKDDPFDIINVPITAFEVEGGANRKIETASPNAISISSELEQARTFKNIIFYVPPTKDFTAVKLVGLRSPDIKFFDLMFQVAEYSGHVPTQTLFMHCPGAWFFRVPSPMGAATPPVLKAHIRFHSEKMRLTHGKYDAKKKVVVDEEI